MSRRRRPMPHEADPAARAPGAADNTPVPGDSPGADTVAGAPPADPAPDIAALLQKVEAEAGERRRRGAPLGSGPGPTSKTYESRRQPMSPRPTNSHSSASRASSCPSR